MKGKTTFLAKASMMLFAVLFSLAANSAESTGVSLPYGYGFENNDLASEGWILQGATSSETQIHGNPARTGSYGFQFQYGERDCYLVSPLLNTGGSAITVSFWHRDYANTYGDEQFQVGYTTDESATDASTFTYGDIVTSQEGWAEYKGNFPAGTKRIAIKYVYDDHWYLFLDDFYFTEFSGVVEPTGLKVSYEGGTEAIVSWASEDDLFDIDVNGTVTENVENPYTLTGLAYETEYTVKVRAKKDGKTSEWSDPVSFTTGAQFAAPTNVAAVPDVTTATVTWAAAEGATGYNLRFKESDVVKASFEEGLGDWTTIDADGDGYDWYGLSTAQGEFTPHDGEAFMTSASYLGEVLYPDNYLVSPKVKLGGSITFWACAQDADWAAEHFGVAVSTTSNTDPTAFTTIKEWTMTAAGTPSSRRKAQGTWGEYTVDLSAYVGQEGYVAIRHFNCSDWFRINVDDITITLPSNGTWTTVNNVTSPYTIEGLTPSTSYQVEVQAVFAGGESDWVGTGFTTPSSNPVPTNIEADLAADAATLTWEGNGDSYKVRYKSDADDEVLYEADFTSDLDGWTPYTLGEGPGFTAQNYNGNYSAVAYSYDNDTYSPFDADNWLVSPALELDGTLKFSITGDPSFPDSYEVLLSTTDAELGSFTTTLQAMAAGQGNFAIDLSAYAGQTGYIAFHHVDYDMFALAIYNIAIVKSGEWTEITVTDAEATISGLATNNAYEYQIQSIQGENVSEWSEAGEFALVTLDCDGENSNLLSKFDGKFAHVTLANRTFYQDGTWNSICLPFDLSEEEFNNTVLADGDLRTITSLSAEGERISINFDDAMGMYSAYGYPDFIGGFPYIIKWTTGSNVVNPEFANVTIMADGYYTAASNEDETITIYMEGTYDAIEFDEDDTSVLFIGENNKLYYPQAGATIGATRGYFLLDGVTAGGSNGVKFYTNLDGDDATGIANISVKESGEWYDLSGRKLAGKPMQKGIYVNGGRKVTIK